VEEKGFDPGLALEMMKKMMEGQGGFMRAHDGEVNADV